MPFAGSIFDPVKVRVLGVVFILAAVLAAIHGFGKNRLYVAQKRRCRKLSAFRDFQRYEQIIMNHQSRILIDQTVFEQSCAQRRKNMSCLLVCLTKECAPRPIWTGLGLKDAPWKHEEKHTKTSFVANHKPILGPFRWNRVWGGGASKIQKSPDVSLHTTKSNEEVNASPTRPKWARMSDYEGVHYFFFDSSIEYKI